ncbi:VWA domain-containing protein [Alienimonas sp. DA493]|uniref:vWA domain-containing protein n=1 Tax=Alienimonas sp. DA493 TaxID=3373605 RepID=UPI003754B009
MTAPAPGYGVAPAAGPPTFAPSRRERSGLLPGWLTSVVLHAALLALVATQLRSCAGSNSDGEAAEGFREVGIRLRSDEGTADSPNPAASPAEATAATEAPPQPTADPLSSAAEFDAQEANRTAEPTNDAPSTLGAGVGAAAGPPAASGGALDAPLGPMADPGSLGGAAKRGVTEFFGLRAEAETFVYVIDCSGSMDAAHEFAIAKREALASLATLGPRQRFQILFFNDTVKPMTERARMEDGFYFATGFNKTLAGQFVGSVIPGGGTQAVTALQTALELEPEAIFFLTDGKTGLSPGERSTLRRVNKHGTRIHCVKFGHGPDTIRSGEVAQLAAEHNGGYQYRDVRELR